MQLVSTKDKVKFTYTGFAFNTHHLRSITLQNLIHKAKPTGLLVDETENWNKGVKALARPTDILTGENYSETVNQNFSPFARVEGFGGDRFCNLS